MTTTTSQPPQTSSIAVTIALVIGLTSFSVVPLSCGTEPDQSTGAESDQATETTEDRAVLLNIGVEDDTDDRPLSGAFLIETPSGERWSPDMPDSGGATRAFEKLPVGETRTLRLYPEGEEGRALKVPITMKSDMSSVLASSRTDIFVYDDSLVITGPAVAGGKIVFDRE